MNPTPVGGALPLVKQALPVLAALSLFAAGCSSPPRLVLESPPLERASFASMSERAVDLCTAAPSSAGSVPDRLAPGSFTANSLAVLVRGEAYGSPDQWKMREEGNEFDVVRAASPEDVRALLCLEERRVTVGHYAVAPTDPSGPSALRIDYEVHVVRWPDGRVLGRTAVEGGDPPPMASGRRDAGAVSGYTRFGDVRRWIFSGLASGSVLQGQRRTEALAFSPDGRLLASGSGDDVRLWEIASGRELRRWARRTDHVCFDASGAILAASGGADITAWDVASGAEIRHLPGAGVAFSPDGRVMATGNPFLSSCTVTLWNGARGGALGTLKNQQGPPLVFSPDGRGLACGDWSAVGIVAVADGASLHRDTGFRSRPTVVFSRDGTEMGVAGPLEDIGIVLRMYRTSGWQKEFELAGLGATQFAFLPGGRALVLASRGGTVVWDVTTRKTVRVFHGQGTPSAIAVSPDGKILATGDLNGSIRLWDLAAAPSR